MFTHFRKRIALFPVLAALVLAHFIGLAPQLHADENLPVYTSPIDITRGRIQLRAVAPERDTGKPIDVPLPVDLLGPKINRMMNTPLGAQMDEYWNVTPDPTTGMTPRQQASDGEQGIKHRVQDEIRYQLLNNTVEFYVTTSATCHRDRGTFACPNDPRFSVRSAPPSTGPSNLPRTDGPDGEEYRSLAEGTP